MNAQEKIESVLAFWFTETPMKNWFIKDTAFDADVKKRFGAMVEDARRGLLDDWSESRNGILALIILLDQMTRNIFRDTADAFSGDEAALALSLKAHERGDLDEEENIFHRQFLLMPMMHSEDMAIQDSALPLFAQYAGEETYKYAILHRDIIARFGRYPHRNAVLGRDSTPEEEAFLREPNSSF